MTVGGVGAKDMLVYLCRVEIAFGFNATYHRQYKLRGFGGERGDMQRLELRNGPRQDVSLAEERRPCKIVQRASD